MPDTLYTLSHSMKKRYFAIITPWTFLMSKQQGNQLVINFYYPIREILKINASFSDKYIHVFERVARHTD